MANRGKSIGHRERAGMNKARGIGVLMASLALLTACNHAPNAKTFVSTTSAPPEGLIYVPPATFSSKITGSVLLDGISGNTHPCRATRLYISLVKPSDLGKFVKLMNSHQVLDAAKIDDPTSGHMIYRLRGVRVTGKMMPPTTSAPQITLEFASLTRTGCDTPRSIQTPIPKLLPTLP